jgi:hypothetical protein|tara:strand:+ start:125 stop:340 length:216 start_codon:yes stop_codon:yes gene_type:complete
MEDYILKGTYQDQNGFERGVHIKGSNIYQCVRRLLDNNNEFSRSTEAKFMGGHIVADYDVSSSVNTIAKYI